MTHGERLFFSVFATATLAAIIVGLALIEPPWVARKRSIDLHRQRDLQALAGAINGFKTRTKDLPRDLAALKAATIASVPSLVDPETGAPYEYRLTSAEAYELCATFDTEFDGVQNGIVGTWRHRAGHQCYEFRNGVFTPSAL